MKFLEAYAWMSESRDNVCLRSNGVKHKVIDDTLRYLDPIIGSDHGSWSPVAIPISSLTASSWRKIIKTKTVTLHECVCTYGALGTELRWLNKEFRVMGKETNLQFTGETREVEVPE